MIVLVDAEREQVTTVESWKLVVVSVLMCMSLVVMGFSIGFYSRFQTDLERVERVMNEMREDVREVEKNIDDFESILKDMEKLLGWREKR